MPARKTPQPEQARKLFLSYPSRTLQEWALLWGTTAERVRQIRHESGVGAVFELNMEVVNIVAEKIQSGEYTLTNRELYEDLPVGYEAFKTWINKYPEVSEIIENAQSIAYKNKLNPDFKECILCGINKSIDNYKKSQKFVDGYTRVCKECLLVKPKKRKTSKKVCLLCKVEKSKKSFTSNKKYRDGLVPFCKTCKSKSRRTKRTLNSKVTDTI